MAGQSDIIKQDLWAFHKLKEGGEFCQLTEE